MPTSVARGAVLLRRPASRLLTVALLGSGIVLAGSPVSAQPLPGYSLPGHSLLGHSWGDRLGDRWDGRDAEATIGGVEYTWPEHTYDYEGAVCPDDADAPKVETRGEPLTVEVVAPEGKLIESYCVKAGSRNSGLGAKVVELDEPVERVTITYPVGTSAKAISHYAVCFTDAGRPATGRAPASAPTTSAEHRPATTAEPVETTAKDTAPAAPTVAAPAAPAQPAVSPVQPAESPAQPAVNPAQPVRERAAPASSPSTAATPGVSSPSPAAEVPSDVEQTGAALTASAAASAEPSPSSSAAAAPERVAPSPEAARLAATDDVPRVAATGRLAFTGAEVVGILLAAVVLITVGTLALHRSRRRATDRD